MKNVWYTCPFVPPEWISAHGLQPRRLALAAPGGVACAPAGACPYANAFVAAGASRPPGDAIVATTLCDQMRRASELVARDARGGLFVMHVPKACRSPNAHRFYAAELLRLGRFLESLGGTAPAPARLAEVMRSYDSARRSLLSVRSRLTARQFAEALADFQESGRAGFDADAIAAAAPPPLRGAAVAVIGGPIMRDDLDLLDRIEQFGGRVVLNATVGAELGLPRAFDRRRLRDDPVGELADAYFGYIPHPMRRPNSGLYRYLHRELRSRGVAGALFVRYVWCDLWHGELARLKEWSPCAVVGLELTDDPSGAVRAAARVQSLMEILR